MIETPEKDRRARTIGAAAAVALLAAGAWAYWRFAGYESTDDAYVDGHVIAVSAKVPGTILRVLVDDNQRVKKDDLLVELDPADYQARLEEQKAKAAAARAEASRARSDAERYQRLAESDEVSRQQLENARAAADVARASYEREAAALKQAELNLSYTRVTAPESGYVAHKTAEAGAYVQLGQPLLAVVAETTWVVANYKETQLHRMTPGQAAEIEVDAFPGIVFHGRVDSFQAGTGQRFSLLPAENATGNFVKVVQRIPVKIVFDPDPAPRYRMAPGMSAVPRVRVR